MVKQLASYRPYVTGNMSDGDLRNYDCFGSNTDFKHWGPPTYRSIFAGPCCSRKPKAARQQPSRALSPKRGVGDGHRTCTPGDLVSLRELAWYYNWALTPNCTSAEATSVPQFVPMVWGEDQVAQLANVSVAPASRHLLAFNEPNLRSQSNLTAVEACALWPRVLEFARRHNLSVGSPAVNHCTPTPHNDNCVRSPTDWLDELFALGGCGRETVQFITTHKYGCNATDTVEYVRDLSARYGKPVWLTEFSCQWAPVPKQIAYQQELLPMLDALPSSVMERYAWFAAHPGADAGRADALLMPPPSAELTRLGQNYLGRA